MAKFIRTAAQERKRIVESSKLIFRAATFQDEDRILGMYGNLYSGLDPLLYRFDQYFNNPMRFSYLVEDVNNNAMVSYIGFKVVDDGRTASPFGSRTSRDYLGHDMWKRMLKKGYDNVKEIFPHLERCRGSVVRH